ncbi:MAG: phosphoglycerate mutase family protein [Rhizobiaceae bacterium]|nr:phosphoglycerate mutase family protein [Rhizobiaceae bacterium]
MLVYYISHPQVKIEPDKPVPEWSLSSLGRQRLLGVLGQSWVGEITRYYSSNEIKALETAEILASLSSAPVTTISKSAEIDRSATGYVPHERHEELADLCFGEPEKSACGWERAVDAQRRIYEAVGSALKIHVDAGPVAFVGHGGVGTLLACKLGGMKINRKNDQPTGGYVFAFEWPQEKLLFGWQALEDIKCID